MKKGALLSGALLILSTGFFARADSIEDPRMKEKVQLGLNALYNLDYEKAKKTFDEMSREYPRHPMGLYGMTTTLWWELTNEYDEKNDALERSFLEYAQRTISLSREIVKEGDPTGAARMCLGGALGLKARWDVIQGHWLAAYRGGKQAFDLQEYVMKKHPTVYDAYLGVGMFHYYTAVLPRVIKFLARFIFGGSREQGLQEIRQAMEHGEFSKTAARLFLVGIYNNNEKKPREALTLLEEGRRQYPESPFFHFVELLTLENAREWEALRTGAEDFLKKIDEKKPFYTEKRRAMGLFALANSYLGAGHRDRALALYTQILDQHHREENRWISLTYLYRGKTHDLLGHRDLALADYRAVLARRDVWQLHDRAKALIKKPFGGFEEVEVAS